MQQQILGVIDEHAIAKSNTRVSALDVVRGLIMAFMALAHCQEYGAPPKDQIDKWYQASAWLPTSLFELFEHALSMLASGGFFMIMGIGMVFLWHAREKEGWSSKKIRDYLIKRGSLLIFLQFTLLQLFEIFAAGNIYLYFGVLFALGSCMIIAAFLLYKSKNHYWKTKFFFLPIHHAVLLLIIMTTFVGGDLIIDYLHASKGSPPSWLTVLFLGGDLSFGGIKVDIDFTPLAWFPAVAFGLLLGDLFIIKKERAWRFIAFIAPSFFGLWLIGRLVGPFIGFGDYLLLTTPPVHNSASFLVMSKYPPSLSFFLYTLGVNLLLLLAFRQWQILAPQTSKFLEPLQVLGRSPLCFFVAHWFVYFALSFLLPKTEAATNILLFWLAGLVILYMICKTYYPWKMSKEKESIWRMF